MTTKKTPAKAAAVKPAGVAVPDNAEKLAPATSFEASGAIIEPAIVDRVDMNHGAVDDNPRERSTADMNRLDLNVPSALEPQEDAVARNLKDQGA